MEIDIANIISAAGTLLAAYFAYNQYTKNKLTDLKVEYFKKEEEKRSYHRSENSAKVFGFNIKTLCVFCGIGCIGTFPYGNRGTAFPLC